MEPIFIRCDFPAIGKGRPRLGRNGQTHTPEKTKAFERAVAMSARTVYSGQPLEHALQVAIICRFERPKSWTRRKQDELAGRVHTQTPDADNIAKAVTDALNGIVYRDDKQIGRLVVEKRWSTDSAPGACFSIHVGEWK